MGTGVLYPEIKRPVRKVNHLPPSGAKVRNERSCTSFLPYAFAAWAGITFPFTADVRSRGVCFPEAGGDLGMLSSRDSCHISAHFSWTEAQERKHFCNFLRSAGLSTRNNVINCLRNVLCRAGYIAPFCFVINDIWLLVSRINSESELIWILIW